MLSHITIGSNDLEKARKFYDAVLAIVGVEPAKDNVDRSGHKRLIYSKDEFVFAVSVPINDEAATPGNGSTVGFQCASEDEVVRFHDTAVANGGVRSKKHLGYVLQVKILAYVRDVDGNKLCACFVPSH